MRTVTFELLWLVPLLPIAAALLLLPASARIPRGFAVATVALAWLGSGAAAALALEQQIERGDWGMAGLVPFLGVRLLAWDTGGVVRLAATPLETGLSVGLALAAGGALLAATSAWGGGARETARPLTGGQLLGGLLAYGAVQLAILASSLSWVIGAASVASVVAWGVLSADAPKRQERDAAGRWFVLLRVGDAVWLVALALAFAVWDTLELRELYTLVPATERWDRAVSGAFAGFPAASVHTLLATLLLVGAATRVPALPLPFFYRQATGSPAPALALVHVLAGFLPGVIVVLRTVPLWWTAPEVTQVAAWLFTVTALVAAVSALNARDALRIDLHLLHALAALCVYAALTGQLPGAVLLAAALALLAAPLLGATGAVVEALQGRLDVFEMGGLAKALKWADRVRALATLSLVGFPGMCVWLGLERTLLEGFVGPRGAAGPAIVALATLVALSLAAFRSLHLVFSGDEPRGEVPANLVDLPWGRAAPLLLLALGVVGLAAPLALPQELVKLVRPYSLEALATFLLPSLRDLVPDAVNLSGQVADGRAPAGNTRFVLMGVLTGLTAAAYVLSAVLYRKGPTGLYERFSRLPAIERIGPATGGALGAERVLGAGLASALSQVARVIVTIVLGVVLDGLVTRVVAFAGTLARTSLRLFHNGDTQRTVLVVVSALAVALWMWGRA